MKIEISISGARQIGKTTLLNKLCDFIEKECGHVRYNQAIKVVSHSPPTESVVIETATFAERYARGVLISKLTLSDEDFKREYPLI